MVATLPIDDAVTFLGSAPGSSGTYAPTVYTTVSGKVSIVEVRLIANDTTGNNGAADHVFSGWKRVTNTATQVGATQTLSALQKDASFAASTLVFSGSAATVICTFTNAGTNAADVAMFVNTWETA